MLQEVNGTIVESAMSMNGLTQTETTGQWGCGPYTNGYVWAEPATYWQSYPVYVYTDKTKKAIEILKLLQAEKQIECKSVQKFIDLVEKITSLL